MNGNILSYLTAIAGNLPPEIISPAVHSQITEKAILFSDFAAREYIMESHLQSEEPAVDFSFQVLDKEKECLINGLNNSRLTEDSIWQKVARFVNSWPADVEDIWLEMDYGEYNNPIPRPCFFFNAQSVKKGHELDKNLLFNALAKLLATENLEALWPGFQKVAQFLPADVGFFQLGVMLARNNDRIRIFTSELTKEQTLEYLKNIGWAGSYSQFENVLLLVDAYSDGQYILDFDLSEQGISAKIGLNFGLAKEEYLPDFLNCLAQHDMCKETKSKGILAWAGSKGAFLGKDYGYAALVKDISHYKISFTPETAPKAKAYLRFAGVYLKELSTRFPF